MLSDPRYIPLVGFGQYVAVKFELEKRSNQDENTGNRKTTRYHSGNVLSGLFVCAECGRNYRRVQRARGEMVWRCANRVEHGNKICKSSPTITEAESVRFVCATFFLSKSNLKGGSKMTNLNNNVINNSSERENISNQGVRHSLLYSPMLFSQRRCRQFDSLSPTKS